MDPAQPKKKARMSKAKKAKEPQEEYKGTLTLEAVLKLYSQTVGPLGPFPEEPSKDWVDKLRQLLK